MNETTQTIKTYSRIGALLKYAKRQYIERKINQSDYNGILQSCESEILELRAKRNPLNKKIQITF